MANDKGSSVTRPQSTTSTTQHSGLQKSTSMSNLQTGLASATNSSSTTGGNSGQSGAGGGQSGGGSGSTNAKK